MHELTDNILHIPEQGTTKLRCSGCDHTLLVTNGSDIMIRPVPPVVLISAGMIVVKCARCSSFQALKNGALENYAS